MTSDYVLSDHFFEQCLLVQRLFIPGVLLVRLLRAERVLHNNILVSLWPG